MIPKENLMAPSSTPGQPVEPPSGAVPAPLPADEADRLAELWNLHILDTPPEERFDRVTRLARQVFDVPVSLVSLIDADRQWFKSNVGLDIRETSRDLSFCAHAILGDRPLVIEDARNDPRFARHPFVVGEPHVRAYLGMPIHGPRGARLGTLCIVDFRPRQFTPADLEHLRDLAAIVENELWAVELNAALTSAREAEAERDKATDALKEAVSELQRLNQAKSVFLSIVSHELRTSLSGIRGFSELIEEDTLTPEKRRTYAQEISGAAQRLTRMVDELLDLDRIESGKLELALAPVSLNEVVQQAAAMVGPSLGRRTLRLDLPPEAPVVLGDQDRLIRVVLNLLTNATKYTPDGGVLVAGAAVEGDRAHVWITDDGPGIAPEALERIFDRYERVGDGQRRGIVGTGLGLPIARHLVRLHGGRLWAESEVGQGATFHVVLPLHTS
jgi:signal transduction histidine kinase